MTPELETLLKLVSSARPRVEAIVIGHTRPSHDTALGHSRPSHDSALGHTCPNHATALGRTRPNHDIPVVGRPGGGGFVPARDAAGHPCQDGTGPPSFGSTRPGYNVPILAGHSPPGRPDVPVGHGRDAAAQVEAFARAWTGTVLAVVDWPEEAASWLRQARRFAAGPPDAWVVAGTPLGWARMSTRLRQSTDWAPERTFGFASTARAVALAEPGTLEGMRGAAEDGSVWRLGRNLVHQADG